MSKMIVSTIEIIEAVKKGRDRFVFDHLYKNCLPKMVSFIIRNNGNEEEAKDIFQDAVLIFYRQVKLHRYNTKYEVDGFIYSISRNLWINRVKKMNRHTSINDVQEIFQSTPETGNIIDELITKDREELIEKVLSALGERCKELLTHVIYNNASMQDISKKMGFATTDAVKTKHYKCKQRLIKLVKDNIEIQNMLQNG